MKPSTCRYVAMVFAGSSIFGAVRAVFRDTYDAMIISVLVAIWSVLMARFWWEAQWEEEDELTVTVEDASNRSYGDDRND